MKRCQYRMTSRKCRQTIILQGIVGYLTSTAAHNIRSTTTKPEASRSSTLTCVCDENDSAVQRFNWSTVFSKLKLAEHTTADYIVGHKNGATFIFTITLVNEYRFLIIFHFNILKLTAEEANKYYHFVSNLLLNNRVKFECSTDVQLRITLAKIISC